MSAINHYQPLLALLLGILGWLAAVGFGILLLEAAKIRITPPWKQVVGFLVGVLSLSLVVQIIAIAGLASRNNLVGIAIIFTLVGMIGIIRNRMQLVPDRFRPGGWLDYTLLGIIALSLLANLLVALAPSTKIDELYYHMLLPRRIIQDGELIFYRQPWEGAVYPQMLYQLASAVFYALGYPDAPNVLSWCTSLTLTWFIAYLIIQHAARSARPEGLKGDVTIALLCAALALTGMYSVVWHVTGGAHALGDLAITALILLLYFHNTLTDEWGAGSVLAAGGISGVAAAGTKISLLPLVLLCSLILVYLVWKSPRGGSLLKTGWLIGLPWLVFYAPVVLWTFIQSGSPFGPMLAGIGGWSIYNVPEIQGFLAQTSSANRRVNFSILAKNIAFWSPLLWALVLYGFFTRWPDKRSKLIILGLLFFQLAVSLAVLPFDLRFLGGIQYALLCILGCQVAVRIQGLSPRVMRYQPLVFAFLLPWLAIQLYYAVPFVKVSLGITPPAEWCQDAIPLCNDFAQLDRVLPAGAQLLGNLRLASVYVPRPVYYDIQDADPRSPLYAVYIGDPEESGVNSGPCKRGKRIYHNPEARFMVYRTPGRPPFLQEISVYQLNCGMP
jgi:hypothetical protein